MQIETLLDHEIKIGPRLSWEHEQYLKRMTLQVCLIGQYGFVLASDTRGVRLGPDEITQHFTASKIYFNERECVAWCSSGYDLGKRLCQMIDELFTTEEAQNGQRTLPELTRLVRDIASSVNTSVYERQMKIGDGKFMLVAQRGAQVEGIIFELGWMTNPEAWGTKGGHPFKDKMVSGATGNAAIFFPERFYRKAQTELEHLRIASHTVLTGHQLDPGPIDGLEIVVCCAGKLRELHEDELESLRNFSLNLDTLVADQFVDSPDVIRNR
jgi:hypothetical protein